MTITYDAHVPSTHMLRYKQPDGKFGQVPSKIFLDAIKEFNRIIEIFDSVEVPVGEILGLRNLSAFVGEVFNIACCRVSDDLLVKNPHQDGYPDLLIMDDFGKKVFELCRGRMREKEPFSPFAGGGIEVKATCGDLQTAKWFTSKGLEKLIIGQQRRDYVTGYNWKAHHRETNNLIGLIWDFIDTKPTIVAVLYSNELTEVDWGETVTPKVGGGRTTSVSIMNKQGISKMFEGLIYSFSDRSYTEKMFARLSKY